jgi:hypothetical protein
MFPDNKIDTSCAYISDEEEDSDSNSGSSVNLEEPYQYSETTERVERPIPIPNIPQTLNTALQQVLSTQSPLNQNTSNKIIPEDKKKENCLIF